MNANSGRTFSGMSINYSVGPGNRSNLYGIQIQFIPSISFGDYNKWATSWAETILNYLASKCGIDSSLKWSCERMFEEIKELKQRLIFGELFIKLIKFRKRVLMFILHMIVNYYRLTFAQTATTNRQYHVHCVIILFPHRLFHPRIVLNRS